MYQAEEDAARAARAAGIRSNKEEAVSLTAASRKHHIKQLAEARDVRLQQVRVQPTHAAIASEQVLTQQLLLQQAECCACMHQW